MATFEMLNRLPKLDDDDQVGVQMEHLVRRDGEPDLRFEGALLASAAPDFRGQDRWREYRVYRTAGGAYVFSKVGRSVLEAERDKFEADMWKENPIFPQSTWEDRMTRFFGYDQLAKQLYEKLKVDTAERLE
jgi:hypothetical protein